MRRGRDAPPPTTPTSPSIPAQDHDLEEEEEGSPSLLPHHPSLPVLRTRRQSFLVRAQLDEANKARDIDQEYIQKLEKLIADQGIDVEVCRYVCMSNLWSILARRSGIG